MDECDESLMIEGRVKNITLSIATAKEIRNSSANDCPITHHTQLMNPFLGLPVESEKGTCQACDTDVPERCEGHFGFIELPVAVYHPNHVNELKNILNLICLKCLKFKKGKVKFDLRGDGLTSSSSCSRCPELPPISVRDVKTPDGVISLELKVPSRMRFKPGIWNFLRKYGFLYGDRYPRPLLACEVLEILKRIPDDTRKKLAGKGHFPQYGYIIQCLPVPPNCLLVPDISDGQSVISNDISISLLRKILNKIDIIKKSRSGPPNFESYESESSELQGAIAQYLHLRISKRTPQDITRKLAVTEAGNLSAKAWLEKMRSLFISKGSSFTSRSVLTGDAYRGIQEIGIPSEIGKKMTFEERVTEWNIKHLQELVDNRQCLRYGDGFSMYSTEEGSKGYTSLKIGQVVSRRIMNGDIVFVNRPPTTHKHALQAFSVYLHDDHTIKINPLICAPFGADFDGDCVHIFYPQSLAAKAEVRELFSVEQQLCSSHSGMLNVQFVNDSLLALKLMCRTSFLKKSTVQQLAMFTSCGLLPPPSVFKANASGPLWTVLQILQTALPSMVDCLSDKVLVKSGEIIKLEFSKDTLHLVISEIAMLILIGKGPKEALKFFNTLQPLLMEILFLEGYSISLADFYLPKDVVDEVRKSLQDISYLLYSLRLSCDGIVDVPKNSALLDLEIENQVKASKAPVKDFIVESSSLGNLIDAKSDSSISKLVQQLGFIGPQLFTRGKLYSRLLVDDIFSHHVKKYATDGVELPPEAYGLIRSSFFHGLNPYEELIHSISTREIIIRSSRGLAEPGTLFKNLMAVLRDVAICYDGTVRNMCSNSIVQFQYGNTMNFMPPGEPVGVLAATAISKPAYAAVLDSSQSTNLSWELMKEILLSKVGFRNDMKNRRVLLFLEDCNCGKMFCKENAALLVQSYLKKVKLKECATFFSIRYENDFLLGDGTIKACPVGHISLDKDCLGRQKCTAVGILQRCEEALSHYKKKKNQFSHIFREVSLSASENCTCSLANDEILQHPCLRFSYSCDNNVTEGIGDLDKAIWIMANTIYPILLDAVIKGDPRVNLANITWLSPDMTSWVRKSQKACKGEVALEVVIEEDVVKQNIDAWNIVVDACLPVMHLIDVKRSAPCGIQPIQALLGISAAFDVSIQRLSSAVGSVAKGVLKEHLILISHSMTCTGSLIGFNAAGYKALFRSLNVQVPFTEATLITPMKCLERAAERCHTDSLSSIVASSLWGKNVSAGTGSNFQIIWNSSQECNQTIGNDVFEFLHMVMPTTEKHEIMRPVDDIDDFEEDIPSPKHDILFGNLTFDDADEVGHHFDNKEDSIWPEAKSSWEKVSAIATSDGWGSKEDWSKSTSKAENQERQEAGVSDGWGSTKDWSRSPCGVQKQVTQPVKISDGNSSWENSKSKVLEENIQHGCSWAQSTPSPLNSQKVGKHVNWTKDTDKEWEKIPSSDAPDGWGSQEDWSKSFSEIQTPRSKRAQISDEPSNWVKNANSKTKKSYEKQSQNENSWQNAEATVPISDGWDKHDQNGSGKGNDNAWGQQVGRKEMHLSWNKPPTSVHSDPKQDWKKHSDPPENHWDGEKQEPMNVCSSWDQPASASVNVAWEKNSSTIAKSQGWGKHAEWSNLEEKKIDNQQQINNMGKSVLANIASDNKDIPWNAESGSWKPSSIKSSNHNLGTEAKSIWDKSGSSPSDNKIRSWDEIEKSTTKMASHQPDSRKGELGSWNSDALNSNNEGSQGWGSKHSLNIENPAEQNTDQTSWGQKSDGPKRAWSQNEKPADSKKWRSDGWGKRASVDNRPTGNNPRGSRPPVPRTETWSAEEEKIRADVELIVNSIRKIRSSYNDGDKLSEDDQKFILEKVFDHHPDRSTKISGEIDHVKVDQHKDFPDSRCFFVVSLDGSTTDFSYIKCLQNFVRKTYPEGEAFCQKYFRRRQNNERSRPNEHHDLSQNPSQET